MKKLILILSVSILFAACSGGIGGPAGFSIKKRGADVPFEKKTTLAVMRPDIKETSFLIANYDLTLPDKSIRGVEGPKSPGQVMVTFAVEGDGKDFKNPLQVGDYTGKQIKWVDLRTGDKGESIPLGGKDFTFNGKISITEITDTAIKGTIDITQDDTFVKGAFEATIVSKRL